MWQTMEGSLPSGNSVISKEEIFITKDLRYEKFVQKSESVQSCYRVAIVARRKMVWGSSTFAPGARRFLTVDVRVRRRRGECTRRSVASQSNDIQSILY